MTAFQVTPKAYESIAYASHDLGQNWAILKVTGSHGTQFSLRLRENDALEAVVVLARDALEAEEPGRLQTSDKVGGNSVEASRPPEPF